MKRRQPRNIGQHGPAGDKPEKQAEKKKTSALMKGKADKTPGVTSTHSNKNKEKSETIATAMVNKRRGRSRADADNVEISECLEQLNQLKKKKKQAKTNTINHEESKKVIDSILSELIYNMKISKIKAQEGSKSYITNAVSVKRRGRSKPASETVNVAECVAKLENLKKRKI